MDPKDLPPEKPSVDEELFRKFLIELKTSVDKIIILLEQMIEHGSKKDNKHN